MSQPNSTPMTDDEILDLVQQMIDEGEIALQPERVNNGADRYRCPACGEDMPIQGHAYGSRPLDDLPDHKADCNAMRLQAALRARQERRTQ